MDTHPRERTALWFVIALGLSVLPFLPGGAKPSPGSETFGRLPVMANGRLQPMDSVARNSLLILSGKQTFHDAQSQGDEGRLVSANEWLQDVLFRPEAAESYKVFLINNEDVPPSSQLQERGRKALFLRSVEGVS